MKDLDKVDPLVKENITFIPCKKASDVLTNALAYPESEATRSENCSFFGCDDVNFATSRINCQKKGV